jgi:site-specific DNA-methyltransferase (adenine-specific)
MNGNNTIELGNSFDHLPEIPGESFSLIYIDPPFNTGKVQKRSFGSYEDSKIDDYPSYLRPLLIESKRLLKPTGSIFVHLDWREAHYIKIELDNIFGRDMFKNEIIWSYDYGGRSKKCWPMKHDTIFWYSKSKDYIFNYEDIDRIPYLAPGLVGPEKAKIGKTPTDVWWNTIVPTRSIENLGYPNQKPLKILERIVRVHSNKGDTCLDFFAGSGSFGEACRRNGRLFYLVDSNEQAYEIMKKRLFQDTKKHE